jgi:hypothetical protein
MKSVSVLAVGVAGVGLMFIWSALHGANIGATVKDLLAGRAPVQPEPDQLGISKDQGGAAGNPLTARAHANGWRPI